MKLFIIILFHCLILSVSAQVQVSGIVETVSGNPVKGANVYIRGSYDGCSTGADGVFSFRTTLTGSQTLIASFIGFIDYTREIDTDGNLTGLKILLIEDPGEIDEVVINAGTFEASDEKKSVILKPIDIALTAGAMGDIFGAFGALPGSHTVAEEGRLFVRGGESFETKVFMDGMLINTPYFSKMPDLPTRGRFSPLHFNGAVFSTGGYSAEFGQALSSIVALNTTALEPEDKSSISLLSVGVQGSHARRRENRSLALTGELLHTGLSNRIFRQKIRWIDDPVIAGSTLMFRQKTSETGMIKTFGSFSHNAGRMLHNNFRESVIQDISLNNSNGYVNTTWNEQLSENWLVHTGIALNLDSEKTGLDQHSILATRKSGQGKISFTNLSGNNITTRMGFDYQFYDYSQDIRLDDDYMLAFTNRQYSAFLEPEIKVTPSLALRAGIRAEHSSMIGHTSFSPRLSAAVKTGQHSQFSAAYGTFIQNPEDNYLKFTTELQPEKSEHFIITWQYIKGAQTLRLEAFNKDYSNLVKFREEYSFGQGNYNNSGSGHARGIDVFWRNQKEFGKSDYWISYSWNNSKRDYRDFPVQATPYFASEHNLSVVYKRFITDLNTFVSGSWSFASGRPYFNPNNPVFMADRTKPYNDISMGLTHVLYLFNTQAVVHLVVNNLFGFNNVFGYTFSEIPDDQGFYRSRPVTPPQKRMAVVLISFQF